MEEFNTFNEYTTTQDVWWIGHLNGVIHYGSLTVDQVLATCFAITFYETAEEYTAQLLLLGIDLSNQVNLE